MPLRSHILTRDAEHFCVAVTKTPTFLNKLQMQSPWPRHKPISGNFQRKINTYVERERDTCVHTSNCIIFSSINFFSCILLKNYQLIFDHC